MNGAVKRNEHAGLGMVEAHFNDWLLDEKDFGNEKAFNWSRQIGKILKKLEAKGYLVVLRSQSACSHCGATWPRKGGPHVTLCSTCTEKHLAMVPDAEKIEVLCVAQDEATKLGVPGPYERAAAEKKAAETGRVIVEKPKT